MLQEILASDRFRLSGKSFVSLQPEREEAPTVLEPRSCSIQVASHWYGDDFEVPVILVSASRSALVQLGITVLGTVLGPRSIDYLRIGNEQDGARGIVVSAARAPQYPVADVRAFSYTRKAAVKKYPWYPWSLNCDALVELPAFGLRPAPGEQECFGRNGTRDRPQSYAVSISGYPGALSRFARLLFDFAKLDGEPEEICLEVEGGYRGVAPLSYELRLARVDR